MIIIGAGLSGCIAGMLHPDALLLEAGKGESQHQAVLRFRTPQIGNALGIPFREVTVHKNIWSDGQSWTEASIREINLYARKVTGKIASRSIADLRPVQRWIAPADLHQLLLQRLRDRVHYNTTINHISRARIDDTEGFTWARENTPVLSTMPLSKLVQILGITSKAEFRYAPIHVTRWRIPNCDAHQTVYFPAEDTALYRATLTGEHLIAETMDEDDAPDVLWLQVEDAFGLHGVKPELMVRKMQRYGKIVPIETELRKQLLYKITSEFGVYSLGRFALWSNILLDDVYTDLAKIRNMISLTGYDLLRSHT